MGSVARLCELELGAARDHFFAEFDEGFNHVPQSQHFGPATADRQHVCREILLGWGMPPNLVQNDLWRSIPLQLDDDTHAEPVGFVANIGDALDLLFLGGFCDSLDQRLLALLVGNFGKNNAAPVSPAFLDHVAAAHHDRALARGVS